MLNQIVYVKAHSLDLLQTAVEEEFIERSKNGHVFINALPLVSPITVRGVGWVQPLVFMYDPEPEKLIDEVQVKYTIPRFDEEYVKTLRKVTAEDELWPLNIT